MKRNLYVAVAILVLIVSSAVVIMKRKANMPPDISQRPAIMKPEQCFVRITKKTDAEPFSVEEYMRLEFDGEKVEGIKFGFQDGPGYTNGYSGTITGTQNSKEITLDYAYIVEGSSNTEQEIYWLTNTGIDKIRYNLIEKNNMLVPDRSIDPQIIPYTSFSCAEFDKKIPQN